MYLVDGSSPGAATLTTNTDRTTTVTWGDGTTKVTQGLGADAPFVDSPNTVSRGDFTATIVPIGDGAVGEISIVIADAADGCERHYWVGPGIDPDQAIRYATQWIAYLDVDRSLTIEETADQACVSSGDAPAYCLDVPQTDASYPIAGGNVGKVNDDVWTLQLLVSKGADPAPVSSLVRHFPLARNPDLELLVDVIPPHESCGRVTAPDGATSNWAIGGHGESTCGTPSAVVEPVLPLVAIDANGDAVLIEALDGTTTVLSDGPDQDDPPPTEGDANALDGVAISPDRTIAIVSSCCEPTPGSMSSVDLSTGAETFYGYGHLPSFTSYGNLVSETLGTIGVAESGNQSVALLEIDPSEGAVVDLAAVSIDGLDLVLAIVTGPSGTSLWRIMAGGGDIQLSAPISTATWTDDVEYSLAGWLDGSIFVLDESNDRMLTFDAETLQPRPIPDVANLSISTWVEPGRSVTIDNHRQLFVNNVHVPGQYLWAR